MAETTAISWTDYTWSPWTGCTRISPACDGCYAAQLMDTRMHRAEWGAPGYGEGTRSLMSESYWKKPLGWNRKAAKADAQRPPFVFPSLCDPFDNFVPAAWRERFFRLIDDTPFLIWLLLTKRIGNVERMTNPAHGGTALPRNVAIGATVCNQQEWRRDWSKLELAKVATRPIFTFVSFEPLLGPIRFDHCVLPDWLITGGETDQGAHKARPTHPEWFRMIRDAAADADRPFHHKQNGEWATGIFEDHGDMTLFEPDEPSVKVSLRRNPDTHWFDESEWPSGCGAVRVGKRKSGRTLDGVEHNAFPEIERAA
ncbi:DUF5131 family protein [Rhizobium sp. RM]|uniref:DUF5131 family protein n=1 Tax=Rhizobium sp. RM TaxID=2748079 RepID=UPI00110EC88C|nr:DUF5131 family protein [Rhizobium sp. RM]NWJ24742.1 DUF5131 family protein [Rhizobium sp. RM]TMV16543.1 DUF5131 family protein [Rhizobium sp. Td3]